jgi:hypothetical protein
MHFDAKKFLSKSVGEDFLETLAKTELYKPNANVAVDIEDIRIGLKVVPRIIMSLLIRELPSMKMGDAKAIPLFLGANAILHVNKHDTDVYSGSIIDQGAVVVSFKYRPLPGVGLVIMSAFELYDMDSGTAPVAAVPALPFAPTAEVDVQKLIDERLALHDLVGRVVEKKLLEKEAIQQLFMAKIKEHMEESAHFEKLKSDIKNVRDIQHNDPVSQKDPYFQGMANGLEVAHSAASGKEPEFIEAPKKDINVPDKKIHLKSMSEALEASEKKPKKVSPLKNFLEKKKLKKNEFHFHVLKSEISCPDCGQDLIKSSIYHGCICLGSDADSKVYIKKSEAGGVNIRFGKSWDQENISMLLEILKDKSNG